jgi:hypothetical protein
MQQGRGKVSRPVPSPRHRRGYLRILDAKTSATW